ncbi:MAG: peptidase M1 [Proteobacteria bacterium]|nr:MAG: peptidase M1 [Pseudomonadota bacterium]
MVASPVPAATSLPAGEPTPGVSRTLADWRSAHYGNIRYALQIELAPPFDRIRGELVLHLVVATPVDLVLDWRPADEGRIDGLRVNGQAVDSSAPRDHLLIPAAAVREGENRIELNFESPIRSAGSAVTRFHDPKDGADYIYSLLVPADASTVFPCFDQPDLKARFDLEVTAPRNWRVIGNAPEMERVELGEATHTRFAATEPISTYLFAFAAGPFEQLDDPRSATRLFVRGSSATRARAEAAALLELERRALAYFEDYFAQPFPFAKHDLVLIPEFPYGGMEHAGATFLREDSILFPFQPSAADRLRRAQLLLHETAHQWFGDLTTMRWFDDLWLKEGFANFMASKAAASLLNEFDAWNAFRALKLAAYRTDATLGTTPIRQPLNNLADAKSAYGSIVYSKAPAVLRQAEYYLGENTFRLAVRDFLALHAYGAADWSDLVGAFERAAGKPLRAWADAWVTRRGLARVQASWSVEDDGHPGEIALSQQDALGEGGIWPMRMRIAIGYEDGSIDRIPGVLDGRSARIATGGHSQPRFVFANDGDFGYALFGLDESSRRSLLRTIGGVEDALLRALLWDALWESVRDAELAPLELLNVLVRELPHETDQVTATGLLARLQMVMRFFLSDAQRVSAAERVEALLHHGMLEASEQGMRVVWFRAYVGVAASATGREELKRLLSGRLQIPGVALSSNDRFRIIRRLTAIGDGDAAELLDQQSSADPSDEGRRQSFAAGAAQPDSEVKKRYFSAFTSAREVPESWIEESLSAFNSVEQDALTLPYLEPALRALPELKRTRKIFFVNDWLAAFVGGQRSEAAVETVRATLKRSDLEPDLRLKLLEAADGLQRTVKIRNRYAR